jgi:hypothetical protein
MPIASEAQWLTSLRLGAGNQNLLPPTRIILVVCLSFQFADVVLIIFHRCCFQTQAFYILWSRGFRQSTCVGEYTPQHVVFHWTADYRES